MTGRGGGTSGVGLDFTDGALEDGEGGVLVK
jgi:hypothetical protein